MRSKIAGTESEADPINRKEAMSSIHKARWLEAELNELRGMLEGDVWEEVQLASLPRGTRIVPSKWVYKQRVHQPGRLSVSRPGRLLAEISLQITK